MSIKVLGINIAKTVFQLHGVDALGKVVLRKRLSRDQLTRFVFNLPQCCIVMEACGGANY
jgi:transposase